MLTHRFLISFLSTVVMYVVLGFLFFTFSTKVVGTETIPEEQTITLSLTAFEPEVLPPVEEVIEEIIEPEIFEPEVIEPSIEPIVEEEIPEEPVVEEIVPEPIVEKIIPKPVIKKKIIKKPKKIKKKIEKKKKKVVKKRVNKKRVNKKVKSRKKVAKRQANPAKKNAFYAKVRAKIKSNKTYPRIAQRRGMQGSVKVKFTILRNGHVSNIQLSGKKVFYKSAKSAIKKAFPISTKNVAVSLPTTVNLTLRYQLK